MSNGKCILAFILGTGVGAVVAWKILADKYERLIREEVMSVREHLGSRITDEADKSFDIEAEADKLDAEYERKATAYGHTDQHDLQRPYVIHPDQFGTFDTYETRSLKCFADRVVTDTDEQVIDDVENLVGDESLDHFGEYEMDSVFVRNDRLKCDFEILLDVRRYSDVIRKKPYQVED